MKTVCVCVCAVLVFISTSNGQTNGSEDIVTPPPVKEKPEKPKEPELLRTSAPEFLQTSETPENETEQTSTAEDFENLDMNKTKMEEETEEPVTPTDLTSGPTKFTDDRDVVPGVGSTKLQDRNPTPTAADTAADTTTDTTAEDNAAAKGGSSWGYVMLILILFVVLALSVCLVQMRRVSRTYTFDLQRPGPSRSIEPIGSFEPVYLDDLDYQGHSAGFSVSVEANGSVLSPEDKEPNGEVEASQSNGLQTPPAPESGPTAETEPTEVQPDQDQLQQDQLNQDLSPSPVLFIEESEEEMNSNNNNQLVHSGPFVEINLDETQSSVQPFGFSSSELQPFY